MKPFIVPFFIPHEGCPYRCVFCDQEGITGWARGQIGPRQIEEALHQALKSPKFRQRRPRQIAFYGGTFTSLPRKRMQSLLDAAAPHIHPDGFDGIRVSTRPDCLETRELALLKSRGVTLVELGAQSMVDEVLECSARGHTARDTAEGVARLREWGFRVGIQLMPGLPGDTPARFQRTVADVIRLRPDTVRLYPAVVLRGTVLAKWYASGRYRPLTLEDAVAACTDACLRLEEAGITVIRVGLLDSDLLQDPDSIVAGPRHPALGALVRSAVYHRRMEPFLRQGRGAQVLTLHAPRREVSWLRGHRNQGLAAISQLTGARTIAVHPDDSVPAGTLRIECS
jgi:histone acetyltransferase (RNA polymerase elongator complex component)